MGCVLKNVELFSIGVLDEVIGDIHHIIYFIYILS